MPMCDEVNILMSSISQKTHKYGVRYASDGSQFLYFKKSSWLDLDLFYRFRSTYFPYFRPITTHSEDIALDRSTLQ